MIKKTYLNESQRQTCQNLYNLVHNIEVKRTWDMDYEEAPVEPSSIVRKVIVYYK